MKNQGFTLIELVVVIVILGILAATAAPKFINFSADAYTATLQGVKASMQSASKMVYGKSLVAGNQGEAAADIDIGDGEGDLNVIYGYPDTQIATWERLLDIGDDNLDFMLLNSGTAGGSSLIIFPTDYGIPNLNTGNCFLEYSESQQENDFPNIDVTICE